MALIIQFCLAAMLFFYYPLVDIGKTHQIVLGGWPAHIGITLANDKISLAFITLGIMMWSICLIYDWNYRKTDASFLFFLLLLEGIFFGIIQSRDLYTLFLFIEISTILSTVLVAYKKDGFSLRAALYYLLFNSVSMILFLLGAFMLYNLAGTLNIDLIAERTAGLRNHFSFHLSIIFILTAAGVKSAFFPVYNWLPKAHGAAPASISALLSGLLVKSGVYVFFRINQTFQLTDYYLFFLIIGFITALSGVLFAISQKDIKQILAFHSVSQVGLIIMGLSYLDTEYYYGGLIHLINHAFFKALLFLGAGVIINKYNERNVTQIRGVLAHCPAVSTLMIIAMLSITGVPFLNGYIGKSLIAYGLTDKGVFSFLIYIVNIGTATSFIKMSQIFFGKQKRSEGRDFHNVFAMSILAFLCMFFGIFYVNIFSFLFELDLSYITLFQLEKWILYFAVLFLGYLSNLHFVQKESAFLNQLRHFNLSFESTNILFISFISILLLWQMYVH
ncbi:complex I subunit 5 family protein [Geosporobacter ferrireducens]|nr:proton-conducting transporter membrane subunit [Geosporobacter ferrireducens]